MSRIMPDEHEVDRVAERLGHAQDLAVVLGVEVLEAMQPAAGEEALRSGSPNSAAPSPPRAAPAGCARRRRRDASAAHWVKGSVAAAAARRELARRLAGEALVQRGDDLEVGDQRAQLGGRAEVELGAPVEVERLLEVVGLDAQVVDALAALVQREADDQRRARRRRRRAAGGRRGRARAPPPDRRAGRSSSLTARCAGRSSEVSTVRSRRSSR